MIFHKKTYDVQGHDAKDDPTEKINISVYKGLFMALLSGIFYCIAAVIIKQMKNIHPGQLAAYRYATLFSFSLPQAVKSEENLLGPRDSRFLLLLSGVSGAFAIYLSFMAYRYLPLGESAIIIYSVPVFVTVAARIFLKEPCGIFQSFAVVATVVGIVFTTKIPQKIAHRSIIYTNEYIYGVISAVGSLFFRTFWMISNRKLKSVNNSVIIFNFGWVGVLETVILTYFIGNFQLHECGLQSIYIILICLLHYLGQKLITLALQCDLAGPVTTIRCASEIILASVCQILLFNDIPDIYSSIGGVLVLVSMVYFTLNKWVASMNEESRYKKNLMWILK